jgi:shikimate kinase
MAVYLIGYMGSGKSKAGEALSKILRYEFVDTDQLVERRAGKAIAEIFSSEGKEYFRELEKAALRTTEGKKKLVVATGGGTPCYHGNMEWMNEHGITVYLEASPGLLFHRLATNKKGRPLLEGLNDVDLMEQITGHLAVRIPVYRQAQITVNAADHDAKALAEKIKALAGRAV